MVSPGGYCWEKGLKGLLNISTPFAPYQCRCACDGATYFRVAAHLS